MKATAHVMLTNKVPEVKLEHGGQEIIFTISVFGRANFSVTEYDTFDHINKYWETLPEAEQQTIFDLYKEIRFGFDNYYSKNDLFGYLSDKVKLLMEVHNLDKVQDWVVFKSDIQVPHTFDVEYTHSIDNNTSREKTYTRSDYIKLVTLSLVLRCMIPIWGEYVSYIRRETGMAFKEFYAFQLLNKSNIVHSIPFEKLRLYIEHIVGDDRYDPTNTLNSISSEDYGYWLLSLVAVRRLCVGDLRGLDPKANIITFIYKYIIDKIRNNDNNCENMVKEKTFDDKSTDSENKISTLERYKVKTNISLGEIVELEYSLRDIRTAAFKITSELNPEVLEKSLYTSQALLQERLLDHQVTILRWVFKPLISPKGLLYLPKPIIVQALGALEAILWAKGHKYLALLVTSFASSSEHEMRISPVDSKIRVNKELADELDKLYPFTRTTNSKKVGVKEVNLAARAIDIVTESVTMHSLKLTADDALIEQVFGSVSRRLPIKPDIKNDLTRLVIEIGNRSWI